MQPEYLILATIPFVGLLVAIDAGLGGSQSIAKRCGVPGELAIFSVAIVIDAIVIGIVAKFLWTDALFGIVDYVDANDAVLHWRIVQNLTLLDIVLVPLSALLAVAMAVRAKRNLGFWLLMSLLVNAGAIAWLLRLPSLRGAHRATRQSSG